MLSIYRTAGGKLEQTSWEEGARGLWIKAVNPTGEELAELAVKASVPEQFLQFAQQEDDSPRMVLGHNCILFIIHVPIFRDNRYDTSPLSILLTPDLIISVCDEFITVLPDDRENSRFTFDTEKRTQFFLQLLYHTDTLFVKYIHDIRRQTNELELLMRKSTHNTGVYQLLDLEKGLTFFTAALHGNVIVAETVLRARTDPRMRYLLEMMKEDEDVLESVIIENKRALELVQTYSFILSSMMAAFASVISNNLNNVMKLLASITILISIPSMVAAFWSMSLKVPWQGTEAGFWLVIIISVLITAAVGVLLRKKGMM